MKYLLSEIKYRINEFFTPIDQKEKKTYDQLKTDGYVVIPDFIDNNKCQELIKALESKVSLDKAWKDEEGSDSRLFGIDRVDSTFKSLFETESLTSIYKKYIDRFVYHHFVMANKVCFKNDNVGSGGGWHRDVMNRRQLKFIMYLNDVDENNGCFQYIKHSHIIPEKWKMNRLIGRGQNDVRYTEDEIDSLLKKGYQCVDLTGKAGTLIIVDTSGIHRGSPLKEGLRYAATNYMSDTKFGESMTELLDSSMTNPVSIINARLKSTYRINRSVYSIFILFIVLFYCLPFIVNLFYPDEYSALYVGTEQKAPILYVLLFLLLVLFMDIAIPNLRIIDFRIMGRLFESAAFNFILILAFLALAINFSLKYSLDFRQNHENSLTSAGSEVIVMLALRAYATVYILYILLKRINSLPVYTYQKILLIIITLGYVLTLTGSVDMLFILLSIFLILNQEKLLFIKYNVKKKVNGVLKFLRSFFIIIFLLFLIISVVFIGNANKTGVDEAVDIFTNKENVSFIFVSTLLRVSNWYASVLAIGHLNVFDSTIAYTTLSGIFNNFFYQLGVMIGFSGAKPAIWSASRMSYIQTYVDLSNPTTGSSPGLIASIFYIPYFPLGMFILSFYTVVILRNLSKAFNYARVRLNGLALLMLIFYILPFFDSPLDMLNIFNPSVVFAVFFLGATNKIAIMAIKSNKIARLAN